MKYQFRKGPIFGETIVEYTFNSVRLLNADGRMKREIWYSGIKELRECPGISSRGENEERFTIQRCWIVPTYGRSIYFQSGSFLDYGPAQSLVRRNQLRDFNRIRLAIRQRAAGVNPNLETVLGDVSACRVGYTMMVLGGLMVCLFVWNEWRLEQSYSAVIAGFFAGVLMASPILLPGWWLQKAYRPDRMLVRETLPNSPESSRLKYYRSQTESV